MQIEIVEMQDTKARLILRDASPALANALRRTMLQDIPKMAIDHVDFHLGTIMDSESDKEYESVTSLFDEIIASRLGLLPVPTPDNYRFQSECTCGGVGCPQCTIMYSLNEHGPKTVLSGDLEPLGDSSLKIKDENIPIVSLTADQGILAYATAVMGTARQHVKWQAAFGIGYTYAPTVTLNPVKAADPEVISEAQKAFPGVFAEQDGRLVVADLWRVADFGRDPFSDVGSGYSEKSHCLKGFAKITWDETSYLFKYETDGSLTARQVLDKALELLVGKADDVSEQMSAIEA